MSLVAQQEEEVPIDQTTDDYYGAGHAEKVAAARERARRKLLSNTSRDSFTTAPGTTPGSLAGLGFLIILLLTCAEARIVQTT